MFTKEELQQGILPVLNRKQEVNREMGQVECMVNNKKTREIINVKVRSNHPTCIKKAIIKGFADRAQAL